MTYWHSASPVLEPSVQEKNLPFKTKLKLILDSLSTWYEYVYYTSVYWLYFQMYYKVFQ